MQLSIKTPSGTIPLESNIHSETLSSPLASLIIRTAGKEECRLTTDKKTVSYSGSVNTYPFDFSRQNTESLRLDSYKNNVCNAASFVSLKVDVAGGIPLDSSEFQNLISFRNSLNLLPTEEDGCIRLSELFLALDDQKITLLSIQNPLTGYDNKSLLNKMKQALSQKIRAICSRPKKGTQIEELVQDISLVKRINTNTLVHLASHTEHWKARTLTKLIPKRLKADVIEEDINIYENLFFKMAIDDIRNYVDRLILSLQSAKDQNQTAIDWEKYCDTLNDYKRYELLEKLLAGCNVGILQEQNTAYDTALRQWNEVRKILSTITNSAFYKQIDSKRRFSKTVHLTNILKNDQRYKALYDIWCLIRRLHKSICEESEGVSNDLTNTLDHYYAVYCTMALLYAMKNLDNITFAEDSYFAFDEIGRLTLNINATDDVFAYRITDSVDAFDRFKLRIDMEEIVNVGSAIPYKCIDHITEEHFEDFGGAIVFDKESYQLRFRQKPNSTMLTALHNIPRKCFPNRHKKREDRQKYDELSRAWQAYIDKNIMDNHDLHDPQKRTLYVSPILFAVQPNDDASINAFLSDLFATSSEIASEERVCYLLPYDSVRLSKLSSPQVLRRLFNYGEAYYKENDSRLKDYKHSVLPINQKDIDSVTRLMKFISIHRALMTLEIEHEKPVHCPLCGSKNIKCIDKNTWQCLTDGCKIEWGRPRCTADGGCGQYFFWIRPQLSKSAWNQLLKDIRKRDANISPQDDPKQENLTEMKWICKKDSLFGKYIITDFEFKEILEDDKEMLKDYDEILATDKLQMHPICPKCGVRHFNEVSTNSDQ